MKYCSTRGRETGVSFEHVLFHSYAVDNGLFMPEMIPKVDTKTLKNWSSLSYIQLCQVISRLFIAEEEISTTELNDIISQAFSNKFDHDNIILLKNLELLSVLELWHGPTLAFKDLALSCVSQFMSFFNKKNKKHVTIVVSTSGDTGSAAIESVRNSEWIDIIVMFPKNRCSKIQELQMTTVLDRNVHVIRGDGSSDDLDVPLKNCLTNQKLVKTYGLCSINSINWVRIMIQIAHYFYAFLKTNGENISCKVKIVVPTGGAGNITAGIVAHFMGLPIKLVAATNDNDIFHRAISTGDFSCRDVVQTLSSAMDIQTAYNMERVIYLFSGSDQVVALMNKFEKNKEFIIPLEIRDEMTSVVHSMSVSNDEVLSTLKMSWFQWNYLIDPHTAVAMFAATQLQMKTNDCSPLVVISPAHADKFSEIMAFAGIDHKPGEKVQALLRKPTKFQEMEKDDNWDKILLDKISSITERNKSL